MNSLRIVELKISEHRIDIQYLVEGEWAKYFSDRHFFAVYDDSLHTLPKGIAVIPFLANVLPIAWCHDGQIFVEELDRAFYDCIPNIKKGYQSMYPILELKGTLHVRTIVSCLSDSGTKGCGALFSGGVDSYYTVLSHIQEHPCLIAVWGADVRLEDEIGWSKVERQMRLAARQFGLPITYIQSNFRTVVNEAELAAALPNPDWRWWHDFQHGIAFLALTAVTAYNRQLSRIYIASTCSEKQGGYTCASDPSIDNFVKFHFCEVSHDAYEHTRQDKINYLVKYGKAHDTKIPLHVCWESGGGENCCKCEKCCRTIAGIYLEDGEPQKLGFWRFQNNVFDKLGRYVKNELYIESEALYYWSDLHGRFLEKYTERTCPKTWLWFYKKGIKAINHNREYVVFGMMKKLRNRCLKILHRL